MVYTKTFSVSLLHSLLQLWISFRQFMTFELKLFNRLVGGTPFSKISLKLYRGKVVAKVINIGFGDSTNQSVTKFSFFMRV